MTVRRALLVVLLAVLVVIDVIVHLFAAAGRLLWGGLADTLLHELIVFHVA